MILLHMTLAGILMLVLRFWPIWPKRKQGCDAYYFLLCAETLRQNRRLPLVLPKYFLAEPAEQWYPPGFAVFLAILPPHLVNRYFWAINQLLDLIPAVVIALIVFPLAGPPGILAGVFVYATYGAIVMEYRGMTSRPLGMVFFTVFLIASYLSVHGSSLAFVVSAISGVLLLYTHKLSVQLLIFLIPALALLDGNVQWLFPLGGAYGLAMLLAPSFFVKVQRAHWDIVAFWYRNWRLLGAHVVKQSPMYGDGRTEIQYYRWRGLAGAVQLLRTILHMNYWVLLTPLAFIHFGELQDFERFLLWWLLLTYVWALLTAWVPQLRCLGLGQQYIKFSAIPSVSLAVILLARFGGFVTIALALIAMVLHVRYYFLTARDLRSTSADQTGTDSGDIDAVLAGIIASEGARLMCLPYHLCDLVAHKTRKPVLWGTHGYGFREVEPFFPVLRVSVAKLIEKYQLTHILLDRNYVPSSDLGIEAFPVQCESGPYVLLKVRA